VGTEGASRAGAVDRAARGHLPTRPVGRPVANKWPAGGRAHPRPMGAGSALVATWWVLGDGYRPGPRSSSPSWWCGRTRRSDDDAVRRHPRQAHGRAARGHARPRGRPTSAGAIRRGAASAALASHADRSGGRPGRSPRSATPGPRRPRPGRSEHGRPRALHPSRHHALVARLRRRGAPAPPHPFGRVGDLDVRLRARLRRLTGHGSSPRRGPARPRRLPPLQHRMGARRQLGAWIVAVHRPRDVARALARAPPLATSSPAS
jgi:hypothetical protein